MARIRCIGSAAVWPLIARAQKAAMAVMFSGRTHGRSAAYVIGHAAGLGGLLLEPRDFPPDQIAVDPVAVKQNLRRTVFADRSQLQHDDPIEAAEA